MPGKSDADAGHTTRRPQTEVGRGRYAVTCEEHDTTVRFEKHMDGGHALAHVDEWCQDC
jgi:hypothetical protein